MALLEQDPVYVPEFDHIALTYDEVAADTRVALAELAGRRFETVLTASRGGLMVAQTVACDLDNRYVTTIGTSKYDGEIELPELIVVAEPDPELIHDKDVLFVDDVYDTGSTVDLVHRLYGPHGKRSIMDGPARDVIKRLLTADEQEHPVVGNTSKQLVIARSITVLTPYFKPEKNRYPARRPQAWSRIFRASDWIDFPWDVREQSERDAA
jgi:hypoxanthine phosphoribosyltransferase